MKWFCSRKEKLPQKRLLSPWILPLKVKLVLCVCYIYTSTIINTMYPKTMLAVAARNSNGDENVFFSLDASDEPRVVGCETDAASAVVN
mmetsp:Transcript_41372/g.48260  ORF Transcript_41372/g.48260 Transcript_41372/m.48260 type:complete len:89 (-) Transcript_41372:49-315(-)